MAASKLRRVRLDACKGVIIAADGPLQTATSEVEHVRDSVERRETKKLIFCRDTKVHNRP